MAVDAMLRVWGEWHPLDLAGDGVPLGTPLVRHDSSDGTWLWAGGGMAGQQGHRPGALAAAEVALTGACDGYVRDGNVICAPLRWYRDHMGIEAYFTQPPSGTTTGGTA